MENAYPAKLPPNFCIIVSGLSEHVNEDMIIKHFEKLDKSIKIKSVSVLRNKLTGSSYCTARIKCYNQYDCIYCFIFHNFS